MFHHVSFSWNSYDYSTNSGQRIVVTMILRGQLKKMFKKKKNEPWSLHSRTFWAQKRMCINTCKMSRGNDKFHQDLLGHFLDPKHVMSSGDDGQETKHFKVDGLLGQKTLRNEI